MTHEEYQQRALSITEILDKNTNLTGSEILMMHNARVENKKLRLNERKEAFYKKVDGLNETTPLNFVKSSKEEQWIEIVTVENFYVSNAEKYDDDEILMEISTLKINYGEDGYDNELKSEVVHTEESSVSMDYLKYLKISFDTLEAEKYKKVLDCYATFIASSIKIIG